VSLAAFQRALCDLIASPSLCLALRADAETTLAAYELSPRERDRLTTVVRQRGMSTNCTLYRSNRITPIYTLLPFTCRSLGDQFGALINQYWAQEIYKDGQYKSEIERFGTFLRQRMAADAVISPFARELLAFELARNALEFGPRRDVLRQLADLPALDSDKPCRLHPLARLVRFQHDPAVVLAAFARGGVPPADLPAAEAFVVLSVADGDLKVLQLDDGTVAECDETSSAPVTWPQARLARELADAGLLLSWQTADKTKASAGV
jgi:hypothetical protein